MIRNEYSNPPQSYKPQEPVITPYIRAKQEWDTRIGETVVRSKNWRHAFFISSIFSLALLAANIYQVLSIKIHPVIITVNSETGQPNVIGKIEQIKYEPKEQEIKYFVGQFVQLVRAVPADPVVIKKNWFTAYSFLGTKASNYLNQMTQNDKEGPLSKIGKETISIKPLSVLKVNGSNSYQARWKEYKFDRVGGLREEYTMTGVFTIKIKIPEDMEKLTNNPLGILIEDFQWNKEL